jgi:hypothetical protein
MVLLTNPLDEDVDMLTRDKL